MKVSSLLCFVCILALVGTASAATFTNYTTNTTDGNVYRIEVNGTFQSVRDGVGVGVDAAGATMSAYVRSDLLTDRYARIYRTAMIFNTSGLPDDAIISSAKVGLYRYQQYVDLGDTGMNIVKFNIDGAISADDYDNFEITRFSTDQNASTVTVAKYYNFSLDALGIANISKTGNTGLGSRFGFDIDNISPTWVAGGSKYTGAAWRSADYVTYPPFIEIEYTTPTPTPTPSSETPVYPWCEVQTLYFQHNPAISPAGYEELINYPSGNDQVDENITIKDTDGPVLIDAYITPPGSMQDATMLLRGLRTFTTYHYVSSAVGTTRINYTAFQRFSNGTEVVFYSQLTDDIDSLTAQEYTTYRVSQLDLALNPADRLGIKVYGETTHASPITLHFIYQGTTNTSHFESGFFSCPDVHPQENAGAEGIAIMFGVVGGILGAIIILRRGGT